MIFDLSLEIENGTYDLDITTFENALLAMVIEPTDSIEEEE